jgi:hypothetical protein
VISERREPRRGGAGKAQHQSAASGRVQCRYRRRPKQGALEPVGDDKTDVRGQHFARESRIDREEEHVAIAAVEIPLTVGTEVGH